MNSFISKHQGKTLSH